MIIDSAEYMNAALADMRALMEILKSSPFSGAYIQVMRELETRIKFHENMTNHCRNCLHYRTNTGTDMGEQCLVNGFFPQNINPDSHYCGAWIFDDIPF